jgi:hypothetical protein
MKRQVRSNWLLCESEFDLSVRCEFDFSRHNVTTTSELSRFTEWSHSENTKFCFLISEWDQYRISHSAARRATAAHLIANKLTVKRSSYDIESASSSDLTVSISDASSSSVFAKKSKKSKGELLPTKNHSTLRAAVDAGEKWEFDLERVHGLTDEAACICVSIVTKDLNDDTLPRSNGNRFFQLAEEGWKTVKEVDRLVQLLLSPECLHQARLMGNGFSSTNKGNYMYQMESW